MRCVELVEVRILKLNSNEEKAISRSPVKLLLVSDITIKDMATLHCYRK